MTMNENPREFKVGDWVRYVGEEGKPRIGYKIGMESNILFDEDGLLAVHDLDGHERMFFGDEWQHALQAPTQAPQATPPILPSTEQLDRFEALLGRLEGILGTIAKGEAA